ncbi:MAG: FAD-linked oxidase C-terminal domain-containing protein [Opitutaceae bacterium]|nr:FAD-linked oxidase C-terminal domain-containing protein [Opitutaceae bacterium]
MDTHSIVQELIALLGQESVLTKKEDLICYSFDGTASLKCMPLAVAFPTTTQEVSVTIQLASKHQVGISTRGSGTGLSGGSVPAENSIVLATGRMNRILEYDQENLTLLVEPGLITNRISETVEADGLFYPPDPSSMKVSTIGGNVANNSGGLRGLKYGVTRDYIMGLEVVLANGEIAWLGSKCVKDVAGYSLKDLFIGSEGTLGIITKVLLKLIPKPEARKTLLALYDSMDDAAATVSKIISSKIIPCTLEFIDQYTLQCVEDFAQIGLPTDCGAVLLMETDGFPAQVESETEQMKSIALEMRAREVRIAATKEEGVALATARRSAFAAVARIRPTTILEDVTVPRDKLVEMTQFVRETAERHNVRIANYGHFGDGNLHPTILADERDEEEMKRVHHAMDDLITKTIELKGTITGEHGIGLAKKKYLKEQFQDHSYELLKLVKRSFDPNNLLNPGKIFDA